MNIYSRETIRPTKTPQGQIQSLNNFIVGEGDVLRNSYKYISCILFFPSPLDRAHRHRRRFAIHTHVDIHDTPVQRQLHSTRTSHAHTSIALSHLPSTSHLSQVTASPFTRQCSMGLELPSAFWSSHVNWSASCSHATCVDQGLVLNH